MLVRFMENAVRFDGQCSAVRVKHQLTANETVWVDLLTVLKAMDVSLINALVL